MIEGTKSYRRKTNSEAMPPSVGSEGNSNAQDTLNSPAPLEKIEITPSSTNTNALNPERRELFESVPKAAGKGLVKILRFSNLLKSELKEYWKREV